MPYKQLVALAVLGFGASVLATGGLGADGSCAAGEIACAGSDADSLALLQFRDKKPGQKDLRCIPGSEGCYACPAPELCPSKASETCDPMLKSSQPKEGAAAIEIVSMLNGSVWVQTGATWNASGANMSYDYWTENLLPDVGKENGQPYLWLENPAGIRKVIFSGMCNSGSAGCPYAGPPTACGGFDCLYPSPLDLSADADNYADWSYYVGTCSDWGYCSGENAAGCTSQTIPTGTVKVYWIMQCQAMAYYPPMPYNLTKVPILIDPAGNKYAQHAWDSSTFPDFFEPVSPAPGWTVEYLSMAEGDEPLIVQPKKMNQPCLADAADLSNSGCYYILAQDTNGTAYHRFYYSGSEPEGVDLPSSGPPCTWAPPAACASACNAS